MTPRTSFATCSLCDAICGVVVQHDGDRILDIRGDRDDPFSRGHVCPKVVGLKHVHEDPDRVRTPLIRNAQGDFRAATWDEALGEATSRLGRLQRAHGSDSVALYIGNPTAHNYRAIFAMGVMLRALKTKNVFSASSMDSHPRQLVSQILYGSPFLLPIPDVDRTDLFVAIGANPAVSNGSIMTAPGMKQRLRAIRERGGRVVVVDPRRTETAALADAHVFVRPGTDALLLASCIHVLFAERLAVPAPSYVDGVEALRAATAPFPPERTAPRTGVSPDVVRGLARDLARARGAVVHGRIGTSTQRNGVVTTWLLDVVHVLTGHFDRAGGAMFATPPVDLAPWAQRLGVTGAFATTRSRVRGLPSLNGELPIAALAEEIETPGRGQIRGLVLHAGNLSLSAPNARRVDAALRALDTLVAVDLYVNETTRHAHVILPPTFGLQNDHFPLLFHGVAVRNGVHYAPAVLSVDDDARDDGAILTALAAGIARARGAKVAAAAIEAAARALPPTRMLDLLLRIGPHRGLTLEGLRRAPHGVDLGPLVPRMPGALLTKDRRVDLAPAPFTAQLAAVARTLDAPVDGGLVLIGRRDLRSVNSWMHNVEPLVRGDRRCTLRMHPTDAAARGLVDGARARVTSRVGSIEAEVEVTDAIMPGVASLPHGWGHDAEGARLRVARAHAGVNVNVLTDDAAVDPISGTAAFNGLPIDVERA